LKNLNKIKINGLKNKKNSKGDTKIKYVFVEDIKRIQVRKVGKNGGIKVATTDDEEAIFTDIQVEIPKNYVKKKNAEDGDEDYDDLIKEVRADDTLDKPLNENEDDNADVEEDNKTTKKKTNQNQQKMTKTMMMIMTMTMNK